MKLAIVFDILAAVLFFVLCVVVFENWPLLKKESSATNTEFTPTWSPDDSMPALDGDGPYIVYGETGWPRTFFIDGEELFRITESGDVTLKGSGREVVFKLVSAFERCANRR